jgi:hypothetical protein
MGGGVRGQTRQVKALGASCLFEGYKKIIASILHPCHVLFCSMFASIGRGKVRNVRLTNNAKTIEFHRFCKYFRRFYSQTSKTLKNKEPETGVLNCGFQCEIRTHGFFCAM